MLQHFSSTVAMTRRSRHRHKSRKPKYLSLRRHLASPATPAPAPPEERSASSTCDMSTSGAASVAGAGEDDDRAEGSQHLEPSPLHPTDHLDRDPHVASLLLLDDGNRSIAALFGDDDGAAASSGSPPAADSPASSSMNWDGLARRALRGRERWVYCHSSSSSSLPAASSSGDEEASSAAAGGGGGGGPGRGVADHRWRFASAAGQSQALALKLDYDEILAAWSDRGPLYIEGDAPQVVPQLHGEPYYAFPVMVEVGPSEAWRVPEFVGGPAASAAGEEERSREERVRRYKEKRRSRLFAKRIRYQVRKQNAEKRPRFKGRFVRRKDYSKDLLLSQ